MNFCIASSTRIAKIGEKSIPPRGGMTFWKNCKYGPTKSLTELNISAYIRLFFGGIHVMKHHTTIKNAYICIKYKINSTNVAPREYMKFILPVRQK